VHWSGQVKPEFTEKYTFYTLADDGVRLWVNGKLLVNDWKDHGPTESQGSIDLQAGQKYDIVMEYFENQLGATAKLSWSSASRAKEVIPTERLYPDLAAQNGTGNGLYGTYFFDDMFKDILNKTQRRTDDKVDFTWAADGRPATAMASDAFSARWNGQVQPRYSGVYTFYVEAQDGFRLWVDNQQIISSFVQGNTREKSASLPLAGGRKYNIRLELFDFRGTANIKLSWSSAGQAREVIPKSQLSSTLVQQTGNAQDPHDVQAQWLQKSGNQAHQSDAFAFGNGLGQVTVYKDVETSSNLGRSEPGMMQLRFDSSLDAVDDVHWLQFITRYWRDQNNNVAAYVYPTNPWRQGVLHHESGSDKWHLDTESLTEAYYDLAGGMQGRSERSISIFDKPTATRFNTSDKEAWALFDTYLVVSGKPVYHVTWERFGRVVSGTWTESYTNIAGAAVTTGLPTWAETDKLLIGYTTHDPTANPPLSGVKEVDNPVPASLR
jgi:hypothetical protein